MLSNKTNENHCKTIEVPAKLFQPRSFSVIDHPGDDTHPGHDQQEGELLKDW